MLQDLEKVGAVDAVDPSEPTMLVSTLSGSVCRNYSGILCVQELFWKFVCAGTVPA